MSLLPHTARNQKAKWEVHQVPESNARLGQKSVCDFYILPKSPKPPQLPLLPSECPSLEQGWEKGVQFSDSLKDAYPIAFSPANADIRIACKFRSITPFPIRSYVPLFYPTFLSLSNWCSDPANFKIK